MTAGSPSLQAGRVLHLVDSLSPGGTERMALQLSSLAARLGYVSHLCTSRTDGALASAVPPDVRRLRLRRRGRWDAWAIARLVSYIHSQKIDLIHAHSSSVFLATAAALFSPRVALVWHDHYGDHDRHPRRRWPSRLVRGRLDSVIAVSQALTAWCVHELGIPAERVFYVPNYSMALLHKAGTPPLPGRPGARIVCLANIRPQKDHVTLVRAMGLIIGTVPEAHLLLVGEASDPDYLATVREAVLNCGVSDHVTFCGSRNDAGSILAACDVGVLSSASEGLPLSLLEYGMARLLAVVTTVGQCADVVGQGAAGLLIPPGDPQALAEALLQLLQSPGRRREMGQRLKDRVEHSYGESRVADGVRLAYAAALKHRQAWSLV